MDAEPLDRIVGRRLRYLRERRKLRQEDVAALARRFGLGWTRATVAGIETGRRQLAIGEFLLLPYLLDSKTPGEQDPSREKGLVNPQVGLIDFVPQAGWIALTPSTRVPARALRQAVRRGTGQVVSTRRRKFPDVMRMMDGVYVDANHPHELIVHSFSAEEDEAEKKVANRLGLSSGNLSVAAHRLWRRSMTDERDRRLRQETQGNVSPRRLQALRGHVTRQLIAELKVHLKSPPSSPEERADQKGEGLINRLSGTPTRPTTSPRRHNFQRPGP
jgi:hypothetical protein